MLPKASKQKRRGRKTWTKDDSPDSDNSPEDSEHFSAGTAQFDFSGISTRSDRSRNSSIVSDSEQCLNTNLSRYVGEPETEHEAAEHIEDIEAELDEREIRAGLERERKKSAQQKLSEGEFPAKQTASEELLLETDIPQGVGQVLIGIMRRRTTALNKFHQIAARVRWGISAIRALVKASDYMRNNLLVSCVK